MFIPDPLGIRDADVPGLCFPDSLRWRTDGEMLTVGKKNNTSGKAQKQNFRYLTAYTV